MGKQSWKSIFEIFAWNFQAEDPLVPPLWEKREKMFDFFLNFFQTAAGGAICFFSLQIVNTLIKISSCDDRPSIST